MPAEIDDLAEALRELGRYLADRVAGRDPPSALASLLRSAEMPVNAELAEVSGAAVIVNGRIDSIHDLGQGEVDVVEYKLTDPANSELDRVQIALYRALLLRDRKLDARPVILRFAPALTVTRLDPAQADTLVERRIVPVLAKMESWLVDARQAPPTEHQDLCVGCPVRRRCAEMYADRLEMRDVPPAGGARPFVDASGELQEPLGASLPAPTIIVDEAGLAEGEALRQRVLALLRRMGVSATARHPPVIGPRTVSLEVSVLRQVRALDRVSEDVIHCLQSEHGTAASYEKSAGVRRFLAGRQRPRGVEMDQLVSQEAHWLRRGPVRFVVGEGMDGTAVVGDMAEPASCHLLIGGTTGSGKSVFLRALVQSMTYFHSPSEVRFSLVDPKRVSFGPMVTRGLGDYLAGPVCHDVGDALGELDDLVEEMERRYGLIERANVEHVEEYNEDAPAYERLPHHVVVVDEFADLMVDRTTRQPFEAAVKRLGGKARAAGIHLVLATQRPDAKVVPGIIKANLTGKIALRVQSSTDSRIVLGQRGAESLRGSGDLLADLGCGVVRAQAPWVK
jgi:S-DNA-T family DNA segregation ATPase FtsK/SpoIIIE